MESRPLYLIKQGVRVVSLLCSAFLTLGIGICDLSMVPSLIGKPSADGWGGTIWPLWIIAVLLAVGCAFVTRATWRQIIAARKAQDASLTQP